MNKIAKCFICVSVLSAPAAAVAGSFDGSPTNDPVLLQDYADPLPWQGLYVGVTAGYNFSGGDRIGVEPPSGTQFLLGDFENHGWSGSLRAGYRWQFINFVVGSEIAIEGGQVGDAFVNAGYQGSTQLNHALSLRMKAGYVVPIFDSFVYGTVGLSRAEFDYAVEGTGANGPVSFNETYATNGYILGVGFERPISDKWTFTGEYEYINYGKDALTDGAGNVTLATPLFHTLKLGLNYTF